MHSKHHTGISTTRLPPHISLIHYEGAETGVLWIEVEESPELRSLHQRINRELEERFGYKILPLKG
jgi:hypothetical protein